MLFVFKSKEIASSKSTSLDLLLINPVYDLLIRHDAF